MKKLLLLLIIPFLSFSQNGETNYSLSFDGNNDYARILNPFSNENQFTVSLWVYFSTLENGNVFISAWPDSGAAFNLKYESTNNSIELTVKINNNNHTINQTLNETNYNAWNYISFSYDGDELYLYLNDNIVVSVGVDPDGNLNNANSEYIHLGNEENGLGGWYNGLIDNLEIWNISLSESEINQFKNCPPTGNELGLVGYWDFDEGDGSIAYDYSGNSNTAELIGGVSFSENVSTQNCIEFNSPGFSSENQYSLIFDSTGDYVLLEGNSSIDVSGAYSLSVWVEFPLPDAYCGHNVFAGATGQNIHFLSVAESGYLSVYSAPGWSVSSYNVDTLDGWHKLGVISNGQNLTKFFIDNQVVDSVPASVTGTFNVIGNYNPSYNSACQPSGNLDKFKFWNYELSELELVECNNEPYPLEFSFWDFEEGPLGDLVLDVSGNDRHGQRIGTPQYLSVGYDLCANLTEDIDGDGILNADDDDIDGDGVLNADDDDIDGDGLLNIDDIDMDGDGVINSQDSDMNNDGNPDENIFDCFSDQIGPADTDQLINLEDLFWILDNWLEAWPSIE